jgi:hypothetical protein
MTDFLRFYYLYRMRKAQLDFEHGTTEFSSEVKAFAHASNETKRIICNAKCELHSGKYKNTDS